MDNDRVKQLQAVYENNTSKGQKTKIIIYDVVFLLIAVISSLILYGVNYVVNGLGGNIWTTLFDAIAVILFVFSFSIVKRLPFITKRNFLLWCVLYALTLVGIIWLVFFIISVASEVFVGEDMSFMYMKVKDWVVFPLCYSLMSLGLILVSLLCFKFCKRCCRRGFGLASKCNYIIEKISKEHVDSVRRENPSGEFGEFDVSYDVYYKNYEYRFYRHYCAVCGNIVYEKMRKKKCSKKYISKLEVFTESEVLANQKRIETSREYFAKKESKTMKKLYSIFEKEKPETQQVSVENDK